MIREETRMTNDPMRSNEVDSSVQPLEYASPPQGPEYPDRVRTIIVLSSIAGGFLTLILMLVPLLGRTTSHPPRLRCTANMRSLVNTLKNYASDHAGALPARLDDLAGNSISPNTLSRVRICTESKVAYIYIGNGMNLNGLSKDTVLIYEPLGNHSPQSVNVAFPDGRVITYTGADAAKLIAELQAGHNPPRAEKLK